MKSRLGGLGAGGMAMLWSHAALLGAELAAPTPNPVAPVPAANGDQAGDLLAELVRAGMERVAADKRAAEEEAKDEVRAARVAAAREKIPADADLKALLEVAAQRKEDLGKAESRAAFQMWLERDEAAAIGWLAVTARYRDCMQLSRELQRWLGGEGKKERLADLLERYPALADVLLDAALGLAKQRGPEFALRLAQSLPQREDRQALLELVLANGAFVKDHLLEVRPFLDPTIMENLRLIDRMLMALGKAQAQAKPNGPSVEELMQKAGYTESMIQRYQMRDVIASFVHTNGNYLSDLPLEVRLQYIGYPGESWRTPLATLVEKLPEFATWCAEMRERRLPPEEVLRRVKAAWPEAAQLDARLRVLVFRRVFDLDPVASLQWLAGANGPDALRELHEGVNELKPEQLVDLLEAIPDLREQLGGDFKYRADNKLSEDWHREDAGVRKDQGSVEVPEWQEPLAALERPDSGLGLEEFRAARAELFRRWVHADLRTALDFLYAPRNMVRYEAVRQALAADLREGMLRDAEKVIGWIVARKYGSSSSAVAELWAEALLAEGRTAQMLENCSGMPRAGLEACFVGLAPQADAAQLAEMRWGLGDPEGKEAAAYAKRKVQLCGGDPARLFDGEEDERGGYDVREQLQESWVKYEAAPLQRDLAVAALLKLPKEMQADAVYDLVAGKRRGGYAETARLLNALDAAGLVPDKPGDVTPEIVHAALRFNGLPDGGYHDAAEIMVQALAVRRDELRHILLYWTYCLHQPSSVGDLIRQLPNLPAGPDRDALLSGPAAFAEMDGKYREKILAAIGDKRVQEEALKKAEKRRGR